MELERILDLSILLSKKSFFLFGPRATGKSTLIRQQLSNSATVVDLLDSRLYLRLLSSPHDLESIISAGIKPGFNRQDHDKQVSTARTMIKSLLLMKFNVSLNSLMRYTG